METIFYIIRCLISNKKYRKGPRGREREKKCENQKIMRESINVPIKEKPTK
jgi:hypothetical protein